MSSDKTLSFFEYAIMGSLVVIMICSIIIAVKVWEIDQGFNFIQTGSKIVDKITTILGGKPLYEDIDIIMNNLNEDKVQNSLNMVNCSTKTGDELNKCKEGVKTLFDGVKKGYRNTVDNFDPVAIMSMVGSLNSPISSSSISSSIPSSIPMPKK